MEIECRQCGAPLGLTQYFCPKCGSTEFFTDEEYDFGEEPILEEEDE